MSFTGKVVLITGAASGIGAKTAIHLSQLGASISLVDRNPDNLDTIAQQVTGAPLKVVADVTTDAERIINTTVEHFGKLDVLINCAGIIGGGTIEDFTIESYDRIMDVNVRSILLLSQSAIKHLEKTKGNIVNLSSVASHIACPRIFAYAMSKAAVSHFTRCAALDLAKKGIRVNAIGPGAIETPLWDPMVQTNASREEYFAQMTSKHPLGRLAQTGDIARAIAFLASDDAAFITGQILTIDGGLSLTTA